MTGNQIRGLREQLGMTPQQLADLVGVHLSTIYRWEGHQGREVHMDQGHLRVLVMLTQRTQKAKAQEFGQGLVTAILVGGGAFALYKLLEEVFRDKNNGS